MLMAEFVKNVRDVEGVDHDGAPCTLSFRVGDHYPVKEICGEVVIVVTDNKCLFGIFRDKVKVSTA